MFCGLKMFSSSFFQPFGLLWEVRWWRFLYSFLSLFWSSFLDFFKDLYPQCLFPMLLYLSLVSLLLFKSTNFNEINKVYWAGFALGKNELMCYKILAWYDTGTKKFYKHFDKLYLRINKFVEDWELYTLHWMQKCYWQY